MPDPEIPPAAALELFCTKCGYSLRGLPRPICPECGDDATPYLAGVSQIPWLRVSGWLHPAAFWKTVFQVSFRDPGRLRFELIRDVDYRHTRAFAWLGALFGWLTLPLATIGFYFGSLSTDIRHLPDEPGFWSCTAFACLVTLVWMLVLSGLHTYFFHPRSLPVAIQNRTLALSYLAAGPLALFPLVPLLVLICILAIPARYDIVRILVGWSIPAAALLLWYRRVVSFAEPLLRNTFRGWMLALLWPVAVLLLTAILLVVIPFIAFFLAVVFVSLKDFV
jgi:hypothetical protein